MRDELSRRGESMPDKAAEAILNRFVNYEAENLVYVTIFAVFETAALILAALYFLTWIWGWLWPPPQDDA